MRQVSTKFHTRFPLGFQLGDAGFPTGGFCGFQLGFPVWVVQKFPTGGEVSDCALFRRVRVCVCLHVYLSVRLLVCGLFGYLFVCLCACVCSIVCLCGWLIGWFVRSVCVLVRLLVFAQSRPIGNRERPIGHRERQT